VATRILIADDHGSLRSALRRALEHNSSYEICGEAKDGVEALKLAQQCSPDVIILDLLMPGLNGFHAAKKISSMLPDVPILLFTMYDSRQVQLEAERCGITAVVSKTQPGRLISALDKAVQGRVPPAGLDNQLAV
jgi:DNA-binding NarL/FixJ family response regulator